VTRGDSLFEGWKVGRLKVGRLEGWKVGRLKVGRLEG